MAEYGILLGIIPLLLFVIVDSLAGLKAGLIIAVIAAIAEALFSYFYLGTLDIFTGCSLGLITLMSLASWKMKTPLLFKLQPSVLGIGLVLALYISYFFFTPLFYSMVIKYGGVLNPRLLELANTEVGTAFFKELTLYSGHLLLIQTGLVTYAAFKLNNWWWILLRGVGFYLAFFLAMLLTQGVLCSTDFNC